MVIVKKIALTCLLVLLFGMFGVDVQDVMAIDEIELPPIHRTTTSANGEFELVITRPERLAPGIFPRAVLYRQTAPDGERTQVWGKALNIYIGPRFVVINDAGIVVFFDEWLRKVDTAYAIQILWPSGVHHYDYTLNEITAITGLNWSKITKVAKYGAWMSGAPVLLDSDRISFEVGGVSLVLRIGKAVLEVQED